MVRPPLSEVPKITFLILLRNESAVGELERKYVPMVPFNRACSEPPLPQGAAFFSSVTQTGYGCRSVWRYHWTVTDRARFLIFAVNAAIVFGVIAVVLWHR